MPNSKRKGNAGELELLHLLEAQDIPCRRNEQRYIGGVNNPDVAAVIGGAPIHFEVKRTERFQLYPALEQAQRDAAGHALPVVAHRSNRRPWVVVLALDDFIGMVK